MYRKITNLVIIALMIFAVSCESNDDSDTQNTNDITENTALAGLLSKTSVL